MTRLKSCVGKNAKFIVGVHKPEFKVKNLRNHDYFSSLGQLENGTVVDNAVNFPKGELHEPQADIIYEIANPFPFRGTTYINSAWADIKAKHPERIYISKPEPCSLFQNLKKMEGGQGSALKDQTHILGILPHPLLIALAQASTDPEELMALAQKSCKILFDSTIQADKYNKTPVGIGYKKDKLGKTVPDIHDHELFEVLVNNRYLPDDYKNILVLKPGVQGNNEITGEYLSEDGKTAEVGWRNPERFNQMGGIILHEGGLYSSTFRKKEFYCLDPETGRTNYVSDKLGGGAMIFADGLFYCWANNGELALVDADVSSARVISSFKISLGTGQFWAHPVIHNGRLYVHHGDAILCYDVAGKSN